MVLNNLQKVTIIGAGGFGREVLDVFLAENAVAPKWDVLGFIDENPKIVGDIINGYPVLGSFDYFKKNNLRNVKCIVAVGDNKIRKDIVEKARSVGLGFCNAVHPRSIQTPFVTFGEGVVVTAGVILTNRIQIGNHVILNLNSTIGHDVVIEDFVNINPGVSINGNNLIKKGAFIGSGAVTIQDITIGCWSIIGAGAVVIHDITDNVVAMGVPAKIIKGMDTRS